MYSPDFKDFVKEYLLAFIFECDEMIQKFENQARLLLLKGCCTEFEDYILNLIYEGSHQVAVKTIIKHY